MWEFALAFLMCRGVGANFEAVPLILGQDDRGFTFLGLTGLGQVVGIADSGVDDGSVFLQDPSNTSTPRDGIVHPSRRKIVQYTPFASTAEGMDAVDGSGHGTFISTSIAGASYLTHSAYQRFNGVAPAARIAMFDLESVTGQLHIPSNVTTIFETNSRAGARVHSNSWGGPIPETQLSSLAQDIDGWLYANQDHVVIFAAGNGGSPSSISLPANAKNIISVGATQVRELFTDVRLHQQHVASFSSRGPTPDGRRAPVVVAPGQYIMSALASSTLEQRATLATNSATSGSSNSNSTGATSRVAEMSGTSCAAPLVSGMLLLLRQFFLDEKWFSRLCKQGLVHAGTHMHDCTPWEPSGVLLKAMVVHSARMLPGEAVMAQGWGVPALNRILGCIYADTPTAGSGSRPKCLSEGSRLVVHDLQAVPASGLWETFVPLLPSSELTVTMTYYDKPSCNGLVTDLDLTVVGSTGIEVWGNDVIGGDSINNVEKVVVDAKTLCAPHHIVCKARILVRHQRGHAQQTFSLVTSTTPVTSDGMSHSLHPTPMPLSTVAELVPSSSLRLITIPFDVNLGTGSTLPPRVFPQPALKVDDEVIARVPVIADEILADLHLNLTGGHVSGIDVALFTVHITLGQEVAVQIGGDSSYSKKSSRRAFHFLRRDWPRTWFTQTEASHSAQQEGAATWVARRDLTYARTNR